jgi:hypothetical protein
MSKTNEYDEGNQPLVWCWNHPAIEALDLVLVNGNQLQFCKFYLQSWLQLKHGSNQGLLLHTAEDNGLSLMLNIHTPLLDWGQLAHQQLKLQQTQTISLQKGTRRSSSNATGSTEQPSRSEDHKESDTT